MSESVGELKSELPPVLLDGVLCEVGGHGVAVAPVKEVVNAGRNVESLDDLLAE